MNLLSVAAAYGVVAYAAEGGWFGSLLGVDGDTPIPPFIPVMMFAILFGLSMDYEVFLLSRIREEYLRTGDTSNAVADGLATTARVITAAAAIMVVVFLSFVFSTEVFLKLMGVGMAAAILFDATVVRMVLVPAVMQLMGRANWWIPGWLDKLLPNLDGGPRLERRPRPATADEPCDSNRQRGVPRASRGALPAKSHQASSRSEPAVGAGCREPFRPRRPAPGSAWAAASSGARTCTGTCA